MADADATSNIVDVMPKHSDLSPVDVAHSACRWPHSVHQCRYESEYITILSVAIGVNVLLMVLTALLLLLRKNRAKELAQQCDWRSVHSQNDDYDEDVEVDLPFAAFLKWILLYAALRSVSIVLNVSNVLPNNMADELVFHTPAGVLVIACFAYVFNALWHLRLTSPTMTYLVMVPAYGMSLLLIASLSALVGHYHDIGLHTLEYVAYIGLWSVYAVLGPVCFTAFYLLCRKRKRSLSVAWQDFAKRRLEDPEASAAETNALNDKIYRIQRRQVGAFSVALTFTVACILSIILLEIDWDSEAASLTGAVLILILPSLLLLTIVVIRIIALVMACQSDSTKSAQKPDQPEKKSIHSSVASTDTPQKFSRVRSRYNSHDAVLETTQSQFDEKSFDWKVYATVRERGQVTGVSSAAYPSLRHDLWQHQSTSSRTSTS